LNFKEVLLFLGIDFEVRTGEEVIFEEVFYLHILCGFSVFELDKDATHSF